jgi:hypothetical protein
MIESNRLGRMAIEGRFFTADLIILPIAFWPLVEKRGAPRRKTVGAFYLTC